MSAPKSGDHARWRGDGEGVALLTYVWNAPPSAVLSHNDGSTSEGDPANLEIVERAFYHSPDIDAVAVVDAEELASLQRAVVLIADEWVGTDAFNDTTRLDSVGSVLANLRAIIKRAGGAA